MDSSQHRQLLKSVPMLSSHSLAFFLGEFQFYGGYLVEFQRKWKTEKKKEKVINRTPVITVISKEGVRVNPIFNEILVGMKGFRHLEIDELMEVKKIKLVRNTLPFVVSRFW